MDNTITEHSPLSIGTMPIPEDSVQTAYKFCQNKGIRVLDLGISSVDGVLNQGLYNFKRRLGAVECPKRKYIWTI